MKLRRSARRTSIRARIAFFVLSSGALAILLLARAVLMPPTLTTGADNAQMTGPVSQAEGVYTALLLGKDTVGSNTDVMMIATFYTEEGRISVLQIPRDTYVRYGGEGVKLGTLYARMIAADRSAGKEDPAETALVRLRETVESLFSVPIDYHFLLNLDALEETVDAMGGVPITVPCDMDYEDPAQSLSIHLKAGKQTLSGVQAVQLVRFRSGYATADLGRMGVQRLFLSALLARAKEPTGFAGLASHLPSLLSRSETNAGLSDALFFLGKLSGIKTDSVTFAMLRGEALQAENGAWYYVLNREAARSDISQTVYPYPGQLIDREFDRDALFTDPNDEEINRIYRKNAAELPSSVCSAADLIQNGAEIPILTPNS